MSNDQRIILLINTSQDPAMVILAQGEKIIGQKVWKNGKHTGQKLLSSIDELLRGISFSIDDTRRIAVHIGPGWYSSLRAGIVTAQILALTHQIELVEITSNTISGALEQALHNEPGKNLTLHYNR